MEYDETQKDSVIFHSYTVIYPRTVMVKTFYASMTYAAVPTSTSSDHFTFRAKLGSIVVLE